MQELIAFIDKLANISGQYTLCEAIKQGYEVCKNTNDIKPIGDYHYNWCQCVNSSGKCNLINRNGELLTKQWYDKCTDVAIDKSTAIPYVLVQLDNKCNYIVFDSIIDESSPRLLSSMWFDDIFYFHDGCARVKLNNKWNYINIESGDLISQVWFDDAENFCEKIALVSLNGVNSCISTNGSTVYTLPNTTSKEPLNDSTLSLNSTDGQTQMYDYCGDFHDGYARVIVDDDYNFIDANGNYLSDEWFDYCSDFNDGLAEVKLHGKWNFIKPDGSFISPTWYDSVDNFENGKAVVVLHGKWNLITTDGEYIFNQWVNNMEELDV